LEIQDVWKSAKEELLPSTDRITVDHAELTEFVDIMMHDANIEESKLETSVLALSLFL